MTQRIVLLFPGQASQYVGMGRLAVARYPAAAEVFSRVDAALGEPISQICFEGPAERLRETRQQQPAVFACSLALYQAWRQGSGEADQVVGATGHSLGEYTALVAAGALSLEDAARLVAVRGRLMQEAADRTPGGMIAIIGMDRARVETICAEASRPDAGPEEVVVLANDNSPEQQVIAGGLAALERAASLARAQGARRTIPLKVAGAFHSPLMAPAVEELATEIERVPVSPCRFLVIANSTAAPLGTEAEIREELIRQVTAPVRWVESIRRLGEWAPDLWVDSGPGNVVAGLAARVLPGIETLAIGALIDSAGGVETKP
ncbi:MAG TPA: ACP S-malonyltransferase [Chloroflexota bacterium]|nr:ACP S-malonyltransferase [Chloroflexota bacterium]